MAKTYRSYLPEQSLLLPPDLRDWLRADHLVHFVSELVDELDLGAIESCYEAETRGQPPYHPRLMVKLLVYGYCVGGRSSRKIAQRIDEDVAYRVLAAGNRPDFRTLSDFRKIHLKALEGLFEQVLRLALEAGALKIGRVALDGTKMKANASTSRKTRAGASGEATSWRESWPGGKAAWRAFARPRRRSSGAPASAPRSPARRRKKPPERSRPRRISTTSPTRNRAS